MRLADGQLAGVLPQPTAPYAPHASFPAATAPLLAQAAAAVSIDTAPPTGEALLAAVGRAMGLGSASGGGAPAGGEGDGAAGPDPEALSAALNKAVSQATKLPLRAKPRSAGSTRTVGRSR